MFNANVDPIARLKLLRKAAHDLKAQGLKTITVSFDGSGDDGCVHDIECEPTEFEVQPEVLDELREAAVDLMVGSFDNDGGGGEMVIDFEKLTVKYHEYYYETVQEESQDWTVDITADNGESKEV